MFLAHSSCIYDGVKIYNLASRNTPLATLCGSTVPGPFLTFGPMLLHFYSDSVLTDSGFMAEYTAIREFITQNLLHLETCQQLLCVIFVSKLALLQNLLQD